MVVAAGENEDGVDEALAQDRFAADSSLPLPLRTGGNTVDFGYLCVGTWKNCLWPYDNIHLLKLQW